MKKLLFITGIVSLSAGLVSLAISALSRVGYYHLMDGSADLYSSLYQRMIGCFAAGIILAVAGMICMVIRFKGSRNDR